VDELARIRGIDAAGHGDAELCDSRGSDATVRQLFVFGSYSSTMLVASLPDHRCVTADGINEESLARAHCRRSKRMAGVKSVWLRSVNVFDNGSNSTTDLLPVISFPFPPPPRPPMMKRGHLRAWRLQNLDGHAGRSAEPRR
jgi:hypothetical protein